MRTPSNNQKAILAAHLWHKVFKGVEVAFDGSSIFEFAAFTGDPASSERRCIINIDNPKVMEKIDKILGPHGRAVLMIMKAQADDNAEGV